MLHPPSSRRERVLIAGEPGTGKSSAWVALASWMEKTKASEHVYVLDTDRAWEAMADADLEKYVTVMDASVNGFEYWTPAITSWPIKPDDWLVTDLVDKAWLGAQTWFWSRKQGNKSLSDVFFDQVQNPKSGIMSGDHGANWGVINKKYGEFVEALFNQHCHVLCCAPTKRALPTDIPEGSQDLLDVMKIRIEGQKSLAHQFHTVLIAQQSTKDWRLTTYKERGPIGRAKREYLKGKVVNDFMMSYLVPVAGWRP